MRIVLVNWSRVWDGASYGGGVNGYCQALSLELASRGHTVATLCGGVTYERAGAGVGTPRLVRHPDWLGVRVYEVVNSPVLAPSLHQFGRPELETSCPELEELVGRFTEWYAPDVVHFHNIEGFSAGCVGAVRRGSPSTRVLYSLHNYHTICPQVYLMQGHTRPCRSAEGGSRCEGCIESVDAEGEKLRRARAEEERAVGTSGPDGAHPSAAEIQRPKDGRGWLGELRRFIRGDAPGATRAAPGEGEPARTSGVTPPTWLEITCREDAERAVAGAEPETRGQARSLLEKERRAFRACPESEAWRPLLNVVEAEPAPDASPYGARRAAMIGALNSADAVLAVSSFVRDKFASLGVDRSRLRVMPIGSRITEVVAANPELVFAPPPFATNPGRAVRLVFMGYNNFYKGLEVLADALELLTPEVLARFDLSVYALDGQRSRWRFERLRPRLAGLTFGNQYDFADIPWMLGGKDLGVVPSVWWDNGPQTVFEYFACSVPVLGAALGGIPDFVRDGVNGVLFRGNDRYDLARALAGLSRNPLRLDELRRGVRAPSSISEHAGELVALYERLLSSASCGMERCEVSGGGAD